ncbi:MAG: hypothetical protein CMN04_01955 [Roseibacillus sp.]|nr:hypothetical protein [Roseibacillus sp.]
MTEIGRDAAIVARFPKNGECARGPKGYRGRREIVSLWDDRQISDLASLIRADGAGVTADSIRIEGFDSLITFVASKEG